MSHSNGEMPPLPSIPNEGMPRATHPEVSVDTQPMAQQSQPDPFGWQDGGAAPQAGNWGQAEPAQAMPAQEVPAHSTSAQGGQAQSDWSQGAYGAAQPVQQQHSLVPEDPDAQRRRRRRKRAWISSLIAVAVIAVLVVAGVIVRDQLGKTKYGPESSAEAYLQAIVDARATDALKLLDPNVTSDERVLLTDEIYAAAEIRPTGYEITSTQIAEDSATVHADLTMDSKRYEVTLKFKKEGTKDFFFSDWALKSGPEQSITLGYVAPSTSVNGVEVDLHGVSTASSTTVEDAISVPVLPGSYTFTAPAGTDYQSFGEDQTVLVLPDAAAEKSGEGESVDNGAGPVNLINFEQNWTAQASEEAITLTRQYVGTCLESTEFVPAYCPKTLEMYEPTYAVTSIDRSWKVDPTYAFDDGQVEESDYEVSEGPAVLISGGDLRIDYEWRFNEGDKWNTDYTSQYDVFGGSYSNPVRVPVTIDADGNLALDFSNL